jgi:light-regulated signal transduction histidine kinase (bacteriophytochrome)
LISNGIKYKSNNRDSKIILQSVHSENELKILIEDNGIGIDTHKYKGQLFEIYQTFHSTKREDSRGVGLYITKTQMEALGGTIGVESTLDEGSTFMLTFKKQKAL